MNGRNYERMGTKFSFKYGPEPFTAFGQQGLPNGDLKYLTWENESVLTLATTIHQENYFKIGGIKKSTKKIHL